MERARYVALTGDRRANDVAIWLRQESAREQVMHELDWLAPRAELLSPGEIRRSSLAIFDRTFAVTYALEIAAVLVGLVGLSSGMGASVAARRREFGVLRHLGWRRIDVARMLAVEGLGLGLAGCLIGGLAGSLISIVLIRVVNPQSFHWTMEMHVPFGAIAVLGVGILLLATATAFASARQATSVHVLRAVRDDW